MNLYNTFLIHPRTVNTALTQLRCRQLSKQSGKSIGSGLIDTVLDVFQFLATVFNKSSSLEEIKREFKKEGEDKDTHLR